MDPDVAPAPLEAVEVAWQLIGLATAALMLYMTWAAVRRDPAIAAAQRQVSHRVRQWWARRQAPREVVTEAMRVLLEEGA